MLQKADIKSDSKLGKSIEENIKIIKNVLFDDETLILRRFQNKFLKAATAVFFIMREWLIKRL